ncbi:MAG: DUF1015 domain-containing protein [Chloroflexota bacterium]|nr:DUF1015 domain-containing protein [Chloroflexota bacterium]
MVEVLPFRGILYSPSYANPGVYAPPYDVIDTKDREKYLKRDPYNIVQLILKSRLDDDIWYQETARKLQHFLKEGILQRDESPLLYGYRQYFTIEDGETYTRTGFMGRVQLEEWGMGIYPHERTRAEPLEDRLKLMRATRMNTSPIFGIYRDPEGELIPWLEPPQKPAIEFEKEEERHIFWRIREPRAIAALAQGMRTRDVVIADGHHRYETALTYKRERHAQEGEAGTPKPYDYVLMYLTAVEDEGLRILPSHRVVNGPTHPNWADLKDRLQRDFILTPLPQGVSLAEAISGYPKDTVAVGAHIKGAGKWILKLRSPQQIHRVSEKDAPEEIAMLDVSVLQNLILHPHFGISHQVLTNAEYVTYTTSESRACAAVAKGEAFAAFILRPPSVKRVWDVARAGLSMPQKSTYFYPKLLTGLVFNPLY